MSVFTVWQWMPPTLYCRPTRMQSLRQQGQFCWGNWCIITCRQNVPERTESHIKIREIYGIINPVVSQHSADDSQRVGNKWSFPDFQTVHYSTRFSLENRRQQRHQGLNCVVDGEDILHVYSTSSEREVKLSIVLPVHGHSLICSLSVPLQGRLSANELSAVLYTVVMERSPCICCR